MTGTTFMPVLNTSGSSPERRHGRSDELRNRQRGDSGNQVVPKPGDRQRLIAHTTVNGNSAGSAVGVQVWKERSLRGRRRAHRGRRARISTRSLPRPDLRRRERQPRRAGRRVTSPRSRGIRPGTCTSRSPLAASITGSSSDLNFGCTPRPPNRSTLSTHSSRRGPEPLDQLTWSTPTEMTGTGASAGTNTFPWVAAGSGGRVDVAWYHTPELSEQGNLRERLGHLHGLRRGKPVQCRVVRADGPEPQCQCSESDLHGRQRQRDVRQAWPDLHQRAWLRDGW